MAIKRPAQTNATPNPLHKFASYTYSWSLWWLDIADYNKLMSFDDIESALSWRPGAKSFVVAEDGGIHPLERQPGTLGLNYHIQEVQFDTTVAPNKISKSSNAISGTMTILEPYGVTLIDTLVAAAWDGEKYNNYTEQPFMLQLDFRGYDDNGNEISKTETSTYTKRFPIHLTTVKLQVSTRGAEYRVAFRPTGYLAHSVEYAATPTVFNVKADTVENFFNGPDGLAEQYFAWYKEQIRKGQAQYADRILFKIDESIGKSKIVNESKLPLSKANPGAKSIDLSQSTFAIPKDTPILDVISKVMSHSNFLIEEQLALEKGKEGAKSDDILNLFKTMVKVEYTGYNPDDTKVDGAFDKTTTRRAKTITFKIHQYPVYSVNHPAAPLFTDSNPYTQKIYNYIYTGQNTDIVDLKLNFDTTFFQAINAFSSAKASEESTTDTEISKLQNLGPSIYLNPAIFTTIAPQIGLVPNATPLKYKFVIPDPNITSGMNTLNRPAAGVSMDLISSIYTSANGDGNMASVQLTIVGDSSLIKQDDWLYIPDPTASPKYTDWDISSDTWCTRYGHLPMDRGEVVVRLNINSPIDIDADITNEGVVYPQPRYTPSLFSGQYKIAKIVNKFVSGKFEQVLHMTRFMNSDITTAFTQAKDNNQRTTSNPDPVSVGAKNDLPLVPTNPSKPVSEQSGASILNGPTPAPIQILPMTPTLNNNALPNGVQARQ